MEEEGTEVSRDSPRRGELVLEASHSSSKPPSLKTTSQGARTPFYFAIVFTLMPVIWQVLHGTIVNQ